MPQDRNEDNKRTNIAHPVPDPPRDSQGPTRFAEPAAPPPTPSDSGATRIVFGAKPELPQAEAPASPDKPAPPKDPVFAQANGPVVGWLVVVSGHGRGAAKEIYIGNNSIGREPPNRIVLDFGDAAISRGKAAGLAYDPVDRNFTVTPGEGANIPRHNGAAVHGPQLMASGDTLKIGQTELRFVPLCGPDFDWEQE